MFKDDWEILALTAEFRGLFGTQKASEKGTPTASPKNVVGPCTDIVPSQPIEDPFAELWDSPTFVREVDESMRSVEKSCAKKNLKDMRPPTFDIRTTPINHESVRKDNNKGKGGMVDDAPGFDLGISPTKDATPVQPSYQDGTSKKEKGKRVLVDTKDAMGAAMNEAAINENMRQKNTKRTIRPGDQLKSPYFNRIVDFSVSKEEKSVHEWCLAMFGEKDDDVFRSPDCTRVKRVGMESLAAVNINVCPTVIDGWSTTLNYEERYRNTNSPRRYFFKMETMSDPLLRKRGINIHDQYEVFIQILSRIERNNNVVLSMKEFELVFFPMCDGYEYYLVVMHLKKPSIWIIDNRKWEISSYDAMMRRYTDAPFVLQRMISHHLVTVGNTTGKALGVLRQQRLEMDWQTNLNSYDSGVFAMRHMETFMGNPKWKSGFAIESQKQETQLQDLKKKYVTKLTLHTNNALHKKMEDEIALFHSLDEDSRADINRVAVDNR